MFVVVDEIVEVLMRRLATCAAAGALLLVSGTLAQQAPVDVALTNGKIITVDERFTIAQAVAVRGDQIVAVGTNEEINRLAGPATRRIDLRGQSVIPGLIDNHMHLLRYATTWKYEVRWDGVETRKEALELLRARAQASKPGEWIYNLGGWALEQFNDDPKPFTRDELDRVAPDNPVFLQASYFEAFVNSRGAQVLGVTTPTGHIDEDGFRPLVNKLPLVVDENIEASMGGMIHDLNRSGLTAVGSAGCDPDELARYIRWADETRLNIRVYCITAPGGGGGVDQLLPRIAQMKLFQGDKWIDHHTYGEGVLGALSDPMFRHRESTKAEDLAQWRRIVTEIAKAGMPLHVHTNFTETIDAFLDQIQAVDKEYPVRNLRWVLAHFNQPNAAQLERMKNLGMYAAVHPWAVINGGINLRQFGDAALDMAPLATIQASGITWGFGSDGSRANQILPFETLSWAVTGKMVGGKTVLRQPISREDALIAHTRKNAYLVFQENNLGSIQAGKLADLVVIDRDYLTIPADQIKDIKVVMTLVGGRIAYEAAAAQQTQQTQQTPITDPLPNVVKRGLSVEIRNVTRLPETRGLRPPDQDVTPAGYARVSYVRDAPDGRRFTNDSRGFLYLLDRDNKPSLYVDVGAVFPRAVYNRLESGFVGFDFHPEFARNGLFYTVHAERAPGNPATPNFIPPGFTPADVTYHNIITEWRATNPAANTFQGTRRELLRVAHIVANLTHPYGHIEFNPTAKPGSPDYGLLYTSGSDLGFSNGGGPHANNPGQAQRLDSLIGAILRIDPRSPSVSGGVKGLGDYTIPPANRFAADGDPKTLGEIYAYGFRNAHRLSWDLTDGTMFAADIGMNHIEEINIVRNGENYGWMKREGYFENGVTRPGGALNQLYPLPPDVMNGRTKDGFTYPVAIYDHNDGQAVTGGFAYHGRIAALRGKFIFGDIVRGRVFAADLAAMKKADDGIPATVAPVEEVQLFTRDAAGNRTYVSFRDLVEATNGATATRADLHIHRGRDGELFLTSRQDGTIRMLVPEPGGPATR
jgi:predicted amidohydrolase YtcJ